MKILVTPKSFAKNKKTKASEMLEKFADEIIYNPHGRPLTAEEIIPLLDGIDGYNRTGLHISRGNRKCTGFIKGNFTIWSRI